MSKKVRNDVDGSQLSEAIKKIETIGWEEVCFSDFKNVVAYTKERRVFESNVVHFPVEDLSYYYGVEEPNGYTYDLLEILTRDGTYTPVWLGLRLDRKTFAYMGCQLRYLDEDIKLYPIDSSLRFFALDNLRATIGSDSFDDLQEFVKRTKRTIIKVTPVATLADESSLPSHKFIPVSTLKNISLKGKLDIFDVWNLAWNDSLRLRVSSILESNVPSRLESFIEPLVSDGRNIRLWFSVSGFDKTMQLIFNFDDNPKKCGIGYVTVGYSKEGGAESEIRQLEKSDLPNLLSAGVLPALLNLDKQVQLFQLFWPEDAKEKN
ncbi:MAG: hypothetical protein GY861_20890 [bacterium]|nr:hypothetical protein [bacterium]